MGRRKVKARKPVETEDTSSEHSSEESEESDRATTPPVPPDNPAYQPKKTVGYRDCNPTLQQRYYVTATYIEGETVRRQLVSIMSCRERLRVSRERQRIRMLEAAKKRESESSPPVDAEMENENP